MAIFIRDMNSSWPSHFRNPSFFSNFQVMTFIRLNTYVMSLFCTKKTTWFLQWLCKKKNMILLAYPFLKLVSKLVFTAFPYSTELQGQGRTQLSTKRKASITVLVLIILRCNLITAGVKTYSFFFTLKQSLNWKDINRSHWEISIQDYDTLKIT